MRLALGISYNGAPYNGWQSQPGGNTIQDRLETALSAFAVHPVTTLCAGRTDAKVHGLMQVVHFDTAVDRDEVSWVRGVNSFLPPDIAIQWAKRVPDSFHARACAVARRYAYVLLESPVRPSIEFGRVGWVHHSLDQQAMCQAASYLIGEHDFTSFRATACQALSPIKTLDRIDISRRGAYWRFNFQGNAFLYHMIRNIMGCLLSIGQGKQPPDWMAQVLAARQRAAAAPTFAPDGLYFCGPVYDATWNLPDHVSGYDSLP